MRPFLAVIGTFLVLNTYGQQCFEDFDLSDNKTSVQWANRFAEAANSEQNSYKKTRIIDHSLVKLVQSKNPNFKVFSSALDYGSLSTKDLLILESHMYREALYDGYSDQDDSLLSGTKNNPYSNYFLGNLAYMSGDPKLARVFFTKSLPYFLENQDSAYYNSCASNIGATHWYYESYDSALIYFTTAKEYINWFNPTLEGNILALANILNDSALAHQQIQLINRNRALLNSDSRDLFVNNAHSHYASFRASKVDSLFTFIVNQYGSVEEWPNLLLNIAVKHRFGSTAVNARIEQGNYDMHYTDFEWAIIGSGPAFWKHLSDSAIGILSSNTSDVKAKALLALIATRDSSMHNTIEAFNTGSIAVSDSTGTEDIRTKNLEIAKLVDVLRAEKKEQEALIQRRTFIGLIVIVALLSITIVLLLWRARNRKRTKALEEKFEHDLETMDNLHGVVLKEFGEISADINRARRNVRQILGYVSSNKSTDIEGKFEAQINQIRFVTQEFFSHYDFSSVDWIKKELSAKDFNVFKYSVLGFRSKDIGVLTGVSVQHVNNTRSKIKSLLLEHGIEDYNQFQADVGKMVFEATFMKKH